MPVTAEKASAIQAHVSTIQTAKSALSGALTDLAPEFAEGEIRALDRPVAVVAKRNGVLKIETLPALVDQA